MNERKNSLDEDVVETVEKRLLHPHDHHIYQYHHQYNTFPFRPTTKKRPPPRSSLSLQVYVIPLALVATTFYFLYFKARAYRIWV